MIELISQSGVKKLLQAGINYKGDSLSKYLESQADAPRWDTFLIGIPQLRKKYWEAMVTFQRELVPQHISLQDLYSKLWELFKEVTLKRTEFQSAAILNQKVNDFAAEVKKPLRTFNVIYEIMNLNIGIRNITAGNVEIFQLRKEHLQTSEPEKYVITETLVDSWEGRFVARLEVSASETDGANLLGRVEVEKTLNVLRLGIRKECIGRSSDSLFLWEIGNSLVIAKTIPEEGHLFSLFNNREIYPFTADIGDMFEKILDEESTWSQVLNVRLPEDIQIRVERAIEWISLAITEQSNDHKLIHLCTALEVLLLPDHNNGKKGEPIALRQLLVGQNVFQEPTGILSLYEQRGDIIHGGHLNITTYQEYVHMLDCCLSVLIKIVHLAQRFSDVDTLKGLLGKVENRETLGDFIKHCKMGIYEGKGINKIIKAAEKRLEQCK